MIFAFAFHESEKNKQLRQNWWHTFIEYNSQNHCVEFDLMNDNELSLAM